MEKMFDQMMQGCLSGVSAEDKVKFEACREKMAAMGPCCGMKDMSAEDMKAMMEKMTAFCGGKTETAGSASCCGEAPK
jgi:hypothetical protein